MCSSYCSSPSGRSGCTSRGWQRTRTRPGSSSRRATSPCTSPSSPVKPTYLLRDHDAKFTKEFDAILEAEGAEVKKVGPVAPNTNPLAERWV
jgi:hypothetical protein